MTFPTPPNPLVFTETVEVWRGVRAKHGDIAREKHHEIAGCVFAPRYQNEVTDGRTSVITGYTLYGPYGEDILPDDQIKRVVEGPAAKGYNVIGEAVQWRSVITGWAPGFEAALERVK